jgi:hypothetical protein
MNACRLMVMAVAACAAGLSLAACTAGISTASSAKSPSPTASRAASSPAGSDKTPAAAGPADSVSVDAPIRTFPIPHGAQVVANMPCGSQVLVELGSVTPAQASTFYGSALPQAGYKITDNTLATDPDTNTPHGIAEITFTGHGYTGLIIAVANLAADASADPSMPDLPSNITKNAAEISLTRNGAAKTSGCPS